MGGATWVGSGRWGSWLWRGGKDAGQIGEGKVVKLTVRKYRNMEEAGNGLPGGQGTWKGPGRGLES